MSRALLCQPDAGQRGQGSCAPEERDGSAVSCLFHFEEMAEVELGGLAQEGPRGLREEGLVLPEVMVFRHVARQPGRAHRPDGVGRAFADGGRVAPEVGVVVQHEAAVAPVHGLGHGLRPRRMATSSRSNTSLWNTSLWVSARLLTSAGQWLISGLTFDGVLALPLCAVVLVPGALQCKFAGSESRPLSRVASTCLRFLVPSIHPIRLLSLISVH
ncbi:hypothetical protein VTI74DRAFT_2220 [Chaetomium olivicolor]